MTFIRPTDPPTMAVYVGIDEGRFSICRVDPVEDEAERVDTAVLASGPGGVVVGAVHQDLPKLPNVTVIGTVTVRPGAESITEDDIAVID